MRTHCQRGHEFTPENTRVKVDGRECKTCGRMAAKKRRAATNARAESRRVERRKRAITELGGKCVECGAAESLHFDHINPADKEYHISQIWHREAVLVTELKKCQLLCAEHHREKTERERHHWTHGNNGGYSAGCRCKDCRAAHATKNREWYRRKAGGER